jgi:hypothetical protein
MTHPAQAEPHQIPSRPSGGTDGRVWPGQGQSSWGVPYGPPVQGPSGGPPGPWATGAGSGPVARRRWPWAVTVLALVALVGGVVMIAVHGRADPAAAGGAAPAIATVPLPTEPSLPPGAESGALGDPSSIRAAAAWVQALVDGDSDLARLMLCTGGLDQFPDGGALQAEFSRVVGGGLVLHAIVDVQRIDGRDRVVFDGLNDSAGPVGFEVSVLVVPQGRSICGFGPA